MQQAPPSKQQQRDALLNQIPPAMRQVFWATIKHGLRKRWPRRKRKSATRVLVGLIRITSSISCKKCLFVKRKAATIPMD